MEIHDNILSPSIFKKLEASVLNAALPYYFGESTAYRGDDPAQKFDFSWSHLVYEEGQTHSSLGPFLETVLLSCIDNSNQTIEKLFRIRIGLVTTTPTTVTHDPHIDYDSYHKTGLLYLNSTDGETYIYKEKYDPDSGMNSREYLEKIIKTVHVEKAVKPEANRFVWFDGLQYHSSTSQTDKSKRVVITFNYL